MDTTDLASKAIKAALEGKWQEATLLNEEILKYEKDNIEALSRLAKAYLELENNQKAIRLYRQVLKLDRFNPIAKRTLERLKGISKKIGQNRLVKSQVKTDFFIEEPSKTKTVTLVRTGDTHILSQLNVADIVIFKPNKHSISIYDQKNHYLGRLPDDLSSRLIKLISRGNKYTAVVKFVDKKNLQIFIREIKQSKRNANISSFPSKTAGYQTFLSSKAIPETPIEIGPEE